MSTFRNLRDRFNDGLIATLFGSRQRSLSEVSGARWRRFDSNREPLQQEVVSKMARCGCRCAFSSLLEGGLSLSFLRGIATSRNCAALQIAATIKPNFFSNGILDFLRNQRNDLVDKLLLAQLNEEDPSLRLKSLPKGFKRASVDPASYPNLVELALPPLNVDNESLGVTNMAILVEFELKRAVSIEFTEENLEYLKLGAKALDHGMQPPPGLHPPPKRARRAKMERIEIEEAKVFPDYRRKSLYVVYEDGDGVERRHYKKPSSWANHSIQETATKLSMWNPNDPSSDKDDDPENVDGGQAPIAMGTPNPSPPDEDGEHANREEEPYVSDGE